MRNIAILTCLKACSVCTGAGCLNAWNQRSQGFAPYQGKPVQLCAFLHCNGCETPPLEDPGMLEKLDRLSAMKVDTVHLGICTRTEQKGHKLCPTIAALWKELSCRGIQVVEGTHTSG